MSPLRAVLAEILAADRLTSLDDIGHRLGIGRDEVDAIVDYWVERGRLSVRHLGGCAVGGCAGCPLAAGASRCSGPLPGPLPGRALIAITHGGPRPTSD